MAESSKQATIDSNKDSAIPNGMPFAVVVESPNSRKKQALLSQYTNFAGAGRDDRGRTRNKKSSKVANAANFLTNQDSSFLSAAPKITRQDLSILDGQRQSTLLPLFREPSKVTSTNGTTGRSRRQTSMTEFAGNQISYQAFLSNTNKRRKVANEAFKISSNIDGQDKLISSHARRNGKHDDGNTSQSNTPLNLYTEEARYAAREQLIREWEAHNDGNVPTMANAALGVDIPTSVSEQNMLLPTAGVIIISPTQEHQSSWTALNASILPVEEDTLPTQPIAPIKPIAPIAPVAPPLFNAAISEFPLLFLDDEPSPVSRQKKTLISATLSPTKSSPIHKLNVKFKSSQPEIINLDDDDDHEDNKKVLQPKKRRLPFNTQIKTLTHSPRRGASNLKPGIKLRKTTTDVESQKMITDVQAQKPGLTMNSQHKTTSREEQDSHDVPLRTQSRDLQSKSINHAAKNEVNVLSDDDSSTNEASSRPKKNLNGNTSTPRRRLIRKVVGFESDSSEDVEEHSPPVIPSSALKSKDERRQALEALRAKKIRKMNPVRKRAEFDTSSDSNSDASSSIREVPTKRRLSKRDDNPVMSEDDFIVSDPEGADNYVLPAQFARESHMEPKEAFKVLVLWCLFVLLDPDFDREENNFKAAAQSLSRKVDSYRHSLFESALWTGSFRAAMARPKFVGWALEGQGMKCDGCRRQHTGTTHVAQFFGPRYDQETLEDYEGSDQEASEDEDGNVIPHEQQEFYLGISCYKKTELAHRFRHWRKTLLNNVRKYLVEYDLLTDYAVALRDKMPLQNRQRFVNNIMIQFEADGKVDQHFYKLNRDLTNAEKWRTSKV